MLKNEMINEPINVRHTYDIEDGNQRRTWGVRASPQTLQLVKDIGVINSTI
jgi:hypothetical protein